jgi:hypothetical protein
VDAHIFTKQAEKYKQTSATKLMERCQSLHLVQCSSMTMHICSHFNWVLFDHLPCSPEQLPPVYLPKELVEITELEQRDVRSCQNVAEITNSELLWGRYTETYSSI